MIAKFGSPANPDRANHENNLRQNEIEEAKFFFEDGAALLDVPLEIRDLGRRGGLCFSSQEASLELKPKPQV